MLGIGRIARLMVFFFFRKKLEEKAKLYEKMTKGDFPGEQHYSKMSIYIRINFQNYYAKGLTWFIHL